MDREKVIKGLNDIGGFIAGRVGFEQARNFLRTIDDALALLKEQEPVEPIDIGYGINVPYPYRCGKCKIHIRKGQNYCDMCGQAVKWE